MADVAPRFRTLPKISGDGYFQWRRDVYALYAHLATDISQHGLLDLILPDPEWAALPGHSAVTPRPLRDLPANPADNASAAGVSLFNRLASNRSRALALMEEAKEHLIDSIGRTNVASLRDPITDMRTVTELMIMTAMATKYSKLSSVTLAHWKTSLTLPIDGSMDIEDFLASHKTIHDNLECVKQPMCEYDKIAAVTTALLPRVAAGLAITAYKMENPDVSTQTFALFTAFLVAQVPNMPISTSSLQYAAHATAPDFEASVAAAVDLRIEAAITARLEALGYAAAVLPRVGAPVLQPSPRPVHHSKYCYFHGYCNHAGVTCTVMAANKSLYTRAKLSASSPVAVAGGSTKNA